MQKCLFLFDYLLTFKMNNRFGNNESHIGILYLTNVDITHSIFISHVHIWKVKETNVRSFDFYVKILAVLQEKAVMHFWKKKHSLEQIIYLLFKVIINQLHLKLLSLVLNHLFTSCEKGWGKHACGSHSYTVYLTLPV